MKIMGNSKQFVLGLAFSLGMAAAGANTGGIAWDKAPNHQNDLASLQNGAKLFVNYCLSCHSAAYMRFNRLKDIGLSEAQIKGSLLFTTEKSWRNHEGCHRPKAGQGMVWRQPA